MNVEDCSRDTVRSESERQATKEMFETQASGKRPAPAFAKSPRKPSNASGAAGLDNRAAPGRATLVTCTCPRHQTASRQGVFFFFVIAPNRKQLEPSCAVFAPWGLRRYETSTRGDGSGWHDPDTGDTRRNSLMSVSKRGQTKCLQAARSCFQTGDGVRRSRT